LLGVCGHARPRASPRVVSQAGRAEPIHEKLEANFQHETQEDAPWRGPTVCQQNTASRSILAAEVLSLQFVLAEESGREVALHAQKSSDGQTCGTGRGLELEFGTTLPAWRTLLGANGVDILMASCRKRHRQSAELRLLDRDATSGRLSVPPIRRPRFISSQYQLFQSRRDSN